MFMVMERQCILAHQSVNLAAADGVTERTRQLNVGGTDGQVRDMTLQELLSFVVAGDPMHINLHTAKIGLQLLSDTRIGMDQQDFGRTIDIPRLQRLPDILGNDSFAGHRNLNGKSDPAIPGRLVQLRLGIHLLQQEHRLLNDLGN